MQIYDITIRQDEILADVANRLKLASDSVQSNADMSAVADVLDDGNIDTLLAMVTRHVYDSMNVLLPYSQTPIKRYKEICENDNVDVYQIRLLFRHERSETQIREARELIKAYIIYSCMAEWLELTMPGANTFKIWEDKASNVKDKLSTCLATPLKARDICIRPHWYCCD